MGLRCTAWISEGTAIAYSREGQYNVLSFVADIESFIELDLYAHPVALVGFGLGAIVAAAFAGGTNISRRRDFDRVAPEMSRRRGDRFQASPSGL